MGQIGTPETSVSSRRTPRNNPEYGRSRVKICAHTKRGNSFKHYSEIYNSKPVRWEVKMANKRNRSKSFQKKKIVFNFPQFLPFKTYVIYIVDYCLKNLRSKLIFFIDAGLMKFVVTHCMILLSDCTKMFRFIARSTLNVDYWRHTEYMSP
jgi:hypothetical protein